MEEKPASLREGDTDDKFSNPPLTLSKKTELEAAAQTSTHSFSSMFEEITSRVAQSQILVKPSQATSPQRAAALMCALTRGFTNKNSLRFD